MSSKWFSRKAKSFSRDNFSYDLGGLLENNVQGETELELSSIDFGWAVFFPSSKRKITLKSFNDNTKIKICPTALRYHSKIFL